MKQFDVTGMSCAACSARVEKAVKAVPGVTACAVSLLTNSMGVDGTADDAAVIAAVENAGYGASVKGEKKAESTPADALRDTETPKMRKRLLASLGFLLLLMYIAMGHGMWGWPVPAFLHNNPAGIGIAQMLLAAIIMIINQKFFVSGFKGLIHRAPNMDTLVALGSFSAFAYSTCELFRLTAAAPEMQSGIAHGFYFESAGMILTLITVGKMLEARAKGKTTDALRGLMRLRPQQATLLRDGQEVTVNVSDVRVGDIFVVRPGEAVPVDGEIIDGHTAVNESALTGESIPVDKEKGDLVTAATVNQSGFIRCRAARVGEDTTIAQIIRMVSDAAATKAPIAKIADRVSGVFVPTVIGIALVTIAIWLLCGQSIGYALSRGMTVLVISCPCALGLATPVAIMVGSGVGAKNGILFKTAVSLEETGKTQIVALDKTGTITRGEPVATDVLPAGNVSENELLALSCALEKKSEHPLAKAVLQLGEKAGVAIAETQSFAALPGNGLRAELDGEMLLGGSLKYISAKVKLEKSVLAQADQLAAQGKTPLLFAKGGAFMGMIAVADVIKEDSAAAIRELKNMGIRVVMITGDNARTAAAIGAEAGVDEVIAGVLPAGKAEAVASLRRHGKVAMVGDGVNDAPALTQADIGIAIGAGADVAIDAADVVLMKSSLRDVPAAIRLSRAVLKNIHENLFWAFFYNSIGIPLAAGAFVALLGWELNPMFGAAAMSLSSFCVVSNALRLNFTKIYDGRRDRKIKPKKEEKTMEKTMKIEGMMCPHCEARVKKALEAIDGVAEAIVSHETDSAVVKLSKDVAFDVLKAAVEAQGYTVL